MTPFSRQTGLGIALLLALAGCGGGQGQTSHSPKPRAVTPSASATNLLVIASLDVGSSMTVRLVDGKGRVTAAAQFTPPPLPTLSNCADLLQPPVRVANGAVFYADSAGVVRRLAADGTVSDVTAFKLTNKQQELSFAVSPDGRQLIAIVLSTPPLHNPPPQTLGDPVFGPGTWSIDLENATAGSPATVALHKDLGSAFPRPTVITGWDAFGATATLNSDICTQAALPSLTYNGALVHLGLDGTHLEQIGGSSCQAWDELVNGTVLCGSTDWQSFSVRRYTGDILWSRAASVPNDVKLSPDGSGVAGGDTIYLRDSDQAASFARTGAPVFRILGWADPHDVVTLSNDGRLGMAAARSPLSVVDLGLTIGSPCLSCLPYGVMLVGTLSA